MAEAIFPSPDGESLYPITSIQPIEVMISQDWSGITDPARRKKLQNRQNQRAWRRRQAAQRKSVQTAISAGTEAPYFDGGPLDQTLSKAIMDFGSGYCRLSATDRRRALAYFQEAALRAYTLGSPQIELLPSLVRFNVFRALIENTNALGLSLEWMDGDAVSTFNKSLAESERRASPLPLRPTLLQHAVEHHPWIDLLPLPQMRDNILCLGDSYDDGPLCKDIVEITNAPGDRAGLVVWGTPWDPWSWEVSEEFLRKWAWVLRGCWELCRSTNYWRAQRGERQLFPDAFCDPPRAGYVEAERDVEAT